MVATTEPVSKARSLCLDYIRQFELLLETPPPNLPEERFAEFGQVVEAGIDQVRNALKDYLPGFETAGLDGFFMANLQDKAMRRLQSIRGLCVFETRAPRGMAEIAHALIATPDDRPHNMSRQYPVPQARTGARVPRRTETAG